MQFRNFFLAMMPTQDMTALAPHLHEVALSQNQVLHEPGARAENVYFPSSAIISVVTSLSDGRGVETATVGFETVVALATVMSGEASHSRCFAQVPGGAIRLPPRACARRPKIVPS